MMFGFGNKYKNLSDDALLNEIREYSNEKAFNEIYFRYSHLVLGVCLKFLHSKSDAEDITITVFTNLKHKISYHQISNFKSWLHSVTKNECLMHLRKNKNVSFQSLSDFTLHLDQVDEEWNNLIELKHLLLDECLNLIKKEQRICITAFYLEKKTYEEISKEFDFNLNEVKSHIQNGKRKLKILISERIEQHEN